MRETPNNSTVDVSTHSHRESLCDFVLLKEFGFLPWVHGHQPVFFPEGVKTDTITKRYHRQQDITVKACERNKSQNSNVPLLLLE